MSSEYYKYDGVSGLRLFKVTGDDKILQVCVRNKIKKGRTYCVGVYFISKQTFIGNYAWYDKKWLTKISATEFKKYFNEVVKRLKKF